VILPSKNEPSGDTLPQDYNRAFWEPILGLTSLLEGPDFEILDPDFEILWKSDGAQDK